MTPDGSAAAARAPAAAALPFRPQATPSVAAALSCTLPPRAAVRGARSVGAAWQTWVRALRRQATAVCGAACARARAPRGGRPSRPGTGKCSGHGARCAAFAAMPDNPPAPPSPPLQIHYDSQQFFVGRLSRQAAAVGADLVLTWQQHCLTAKTAQKVRQPAGLGGWGGVGVAGAG